MLNSRPSVLYWNVQQCHKYYMTYSTQGIACHDPAAAEGTPQLQEGEACCSSSKFIGALLATQKAIWPHLTWASHTSPTTQPKHVTTSWMLLHMVSSSNHSPNTVYSKHSVAPCFYNILAYLPLTCQVNLVPIAVYFNQSTHKVFFVSPHGHTPRTFLMSPHSHLCI